MTGVLRGSPPRSVHRERAVAKSNPRNCYHPLCLPSHHQGPWPSQPPSLPWLLRHSESSDVQTRSRPTEEFQLQSSVCPMLPSARTAGKLKQSEFFVLVIKGMWVLSGITDRKHPRHFSTSGQVFCQGCLSLRGTEPRVSGADSSQTPDEGWWWGCLFCRPRVCGESSILDPERNACFQTPELCGMPVPTDPRPGALTAYSRAGDEGKCLPTDPRLGIVVVETATDPRIWGTVFI